MSKLCIFLYIIINIDKYNVFKYKFKTGNNLLNQITMKESIVDIIII